MCVSRRYLDLFERLLSTDHVHNIVGVLCYLQSVTESLSTAVSATTTPAQTTTTDTTTTSSSSVLLALWTSLVAALQRHLNTVSYSSLTTITAHVDICWRYTRLFLG